MENKKYKYLLLTISKLDVKLLEEINFIAMNELGCDGIEEFSLEEKRVDEILGKRAYSGGDIPEELLDEVDRVTKKEDLVIFRYYFYKGDMDSHVSLMRNFLDQNYKKTSVEYKVFEEPFEDWNTDWRKHYDTIEISNDILVVPQWMKEDNLKTNEKNIYIYPGMGFGTGEHETTNLCLKIYDEIKKSFSPNDLCLDFGCGSGILGIAAMKFSNLTVDFCDIDKSALDNCVQNLSINFEGNDLSGQRLVIRDRFSAGEKKYALVFANILEHILLLEKEVILESLSDNGYLIVSGLLNSQVENIILTYSEKLTMIEVMTSGEWSAILFKSDKREGSKP